MTSLRRATASSARERTAVERWLASTETTRKAIRATQFSGSAIVSVPTGGRKKKLNDSIAAIDAPMATGRRARVAVPSTTSSSTSATVVGLRPGTARIATVAAASVARLTDAGRRSARTTAMVPFCHSPSRHVRRARLF